MNENQTPSIVEIRIESAYGNTRAYPVNETAKLFCELIKRNSIPKRGLEIIQKLGFEIVIKDKTFNLEDVT